jgi:hypothetical protein
MICYKLDKDIKCEDICKSLQIMFNKLRSDGVDISDKLLTIKLVDIAYTIDDFVPKLEHKEI